MKDKMKILQKVERTGTEIIIVVVVDSVLLPLKSYRHFADILAKCVLLISYCEILS